MTAINPKKIAQANLKPLNREALVWLKEAGQPTPREEGLYLLALASWGQEKGATAPGLDSGQNASLVEAVNVMHVRDPDEWLRWLVSNPNGPDSTEEQMQTLLQALKEASSPVNAAEVVLEAIGSRLATGYPHYQSAASELA